MMSFDMQQVPDLVVPYHSQHFQICRAEPTAETNSQCNTGLLTNLNGRNSILSCQSKRLLDKDMLARMCRLTDLVDML